jgi:hypothetical protein
MAEEGRERPEATELWQRLLHVLDEYVNVVVWGHPLDHALAVRHLQNLYQVGERPSHDDFKAYLDDLWPHGPGARKAVRGIWRTILRNPHHGFRIKQGEVSLATLDRLATMMAREYGSPPLEWRVLDVLKEAHKRFARVTLEDPDYEAFLFARRDLRSAMRTLARVRELRLGPKSTGNWLELGADEVPPEQLRAWDKLRQRYAWPP